MRFFVPDFNEKNFDAHQIAQESDETIMPKRKFSLPANLAWQ